VTVVTASQGSVDVKEQKSFHGASDSRKSNR
jgi:hypothetical protein